MIIQITDAEYTSLRYASRQYESAHILYRELTEIAPDIYDIPNTYMWDALEATVEDGADLGNVPTICVSLREKLKKAFSELIE